MLVYRKFAPERLLKEWSRGLPRPFAHVLRNFKSTAKSLQYPHYSLERIFKLLLKAPLITVKWLLAVGWHLAFVSPVLRRRSQLPTPTKLPRAVNSKGAESHCAHRLADVRSIP